MTFTEYIGNPKIILMIMAGIFVVETFLVAIQVGYFRYTKKRFGKGKRIFLMAPLHHHYQLSEIPEAKIVTRFWIIGLLLAIITIATLKIR